MGESSRSSTDPKAYTRASLDLRSRQLRQQMVRVLGAGQRGHLASAFSLTEILRVLYDDILRYDPKQPKWPGRDRFLLSKGHGCIAQYVLLAEKGYFPEAELWQFCKTGAILGGHPDHRKIPGVEASTGSLGHGLPIGLGMALNARFEKSSARVFVVVGDGETNEGSIWEAALSAGKHQLSNLTVLIDHNKQQSYGTTFEVQNLEPLADKWRSFQFEVAEVDGHDVSTLRSLLTRVPLHPQKPTAVICHTVKGRGIAHIEQDLAWHHKNRVTPEDVQALLSALEVDR